MPGRKQKRALTLQACAVAVVRADPTNRDYGELSERVKQLAARRGVTWRVGHEVTAALERAWRYAGD